jgi:hypothetical protein
MMRRRLHVLTLALVATAAVAVIAAGSGLAANAVTVVGTINGGGTAQMEDGMGTTHWGAGIKLYSDGTASGSFDCVDQHGDAPGYPGNIWGKVTNWSIDANGVVSLLVVGKFVPIPGGHPSEAEFIIRVQKFGGAGVGHWTLEVGGTLNQPGFVICFEILTSGQIVARWT